MVPLEKPDRILFFVLALLLCWNLGRLELTVTDEARTAMVVRDMVEGGRWQLPRTPDGHLYEKPPVFTGACAIAGSLLGIRESTLRGVSVIMALGTSLLVWILGALYGSPRAARIAVVAFVANGIFVTTARDAMVDMTLTFFLTAGFTAYFAARAGRLAPWKAAALGGLAFGLAILSKGPSLLTLPIAIIGGDALIEHRGRFWRSLKWWPQGLLAIALTVALACLWYIPAYLKGGKEFLDTCLLTENFKMPKGDDELGIGVAHRKPFYYYFGLQLGVILAMLPLLPALLAWARDRESDPARRHLAVWFAFGFLLFQIAANKRTYYLLPLQPAVALMIGLAVDRALTRGDARWLKVTATAMGALVVAAALGALAVAVRPELLSQVREGTVSEAVAAQRGWIMLFGTGLLLVGALLLRDARRAPEAAVRAACLLALFAVAVRFGLGDRIQAEFDRTRPFVAEMVPKLPPGKAPVMLPPLRGFSIDYYWPGRILRDRELALRSEYVLVSRKQLPGVPEPYETLGTWKYGPKGRDDILLIRRAP